MEKVAYFDKTEKVPINGAQLTIFDNPEEFPVKPGITPLLVADHINNLPQKINEAKNSSCTFTGTDLLNRKILEIPCLVEPIFPKVGLIAVGGSSDTGKSSLLRQLAVAVSTGESDFMGFKINAKYKSAIYVSTEDDDLATSFLLQKTNHEKQLPHELYKGLRYIFTTEELLTRLDKELIEAKSDLVIIDAFSDLYGKGMNESNQVRTFLNDYSQLAQKHQCLVIFLHHTGKRTEDLEPNKNNLLGSQGFEAKMRLVIELSLDPYDADKRHLCIVKGNYLSRSYKTESYVLLFDENLQFSLTDSRVPFSDLVGGNKQGLKDRIIELHDSGLKQDEIASELAISQSTVSRVLRSK